MLEILQFIFSSFWVFAGVCILVAFLSACLYRICELIGKHGPFTYAGLKRQAVKEIIYKDIVNSNELDNKENLAKKKICMVNETISVARK